MKMTSSNEYVQGPPLYTDRMSETPYSIELSSDQRSHVRNDSLTSHQYEKILYNDHY